MLNIVIPMAGRGKRFKEAGYAFPKPLIDVGGKPMVEWVIANVKPASREHRFVFICQRDHYERYDLRSIFGNATEGKFEVIQIGSITAGAACTVLTASRFINSGDPLLIANADQFVAGGISDFLSQAEESGSDGLILTFLSSHPKWSYARTARETGDVVEVAEKKVISDQATVGIYYFREGRDFVEGATRMISRNIRYSNEFYVCPVYNELILAGKRVRAHPIENERMHGLGTPEDLNRFLEKLNSGQVSAA